MACECKRERERGRERERERERERSYIDNQEVTESLFLLCHASAQNASTMEGRRWSPLLDGVRRAERRGLELELRAEMRGEAVENADLNSVSTVRPKPTCEWFWEDVRLRTMQEISFFFVHQNLRARSRCKDCGGAGICEHNRVRRLCRDCGGAGMCAHSRVRSKCKDCKERRRNTKCRRRLRLMLHSRCCTAAFDTNIRACTQAHTQTGIQANIKHTHARTRTRTKTHHTHTQTHTHTHTQTHTHTHILHTPLQ
jgi:hypothetical protein